jgi:hypothetical protein
LPLIRPHWIIVVKRKFGYLGHDLRAAFRYDQLIIFSLRTSARNKRPDIAPDFGSASRRGKGRIAALCNPCRNTEDGPKDKQDRMIISCRSPYSPFQKRR